MIENLEGIIINEKDYSETSKILTIITKKYGVISVISKGCKTMKSELRSASSKLNYGNFNIIYKQDKLSTLTSADIINSYKNIRSDLLKISYASFLLELVDQVIKQNNDKNIFIILIEALKKIEENYDPIVISDIVSLKYLDYLGVLPVLDACAMCGSTSSIATISSDKGGYICNKCRTNEILVSEKAIKLIRMFYYVDISKISKLDISNNVRTEIHSFIDRYYDRYTGLYFKTKKLLKVNGELNVRTK